MTTEPVMPVDFKTLFERSAGLFLVLDRDLCAVAATDAFCARMRLPREKLLGKTLEDVIPHAPTGAAADSFGRLRASLDRVLKLRRPDVVGVQRYDTPRDDGTVEEHHYSQRNSPVLDESGEVRLIVHRIFDVTDSVLHPDSDAAHRQKTFSQERLISELRRNNEELAQLDALRARLMDMSRLSTMATMASALAHDVSQPLTAARNYVSALKRLRTNGSDDKVDDLVSKIGQQVERAGEIVKSLRGFMAAGNTVQRNEPLAPVIADAVRLSGAALQAAGAGLKIEIAPDLPAVTIDRIQIQQVIVNLLAAAAESVSGGEDREIVLRADEGDCAIRIVVADRGAGLAAGEAKQFLEPFATANLMGAGFGLAIAHQIVAEHKGTIIVEPNTPSGSIVTVTLPCVGEDLEREAWAGVEGGS